MNRATARSKYGYVFGGLSINYIDFAIVRRSQRRSRLLDINSSAIVYKRTSTSMPI